MGAALIKEDNPEESWMEQEEYNIDGPLWFDKYISRLIPWPVSLILRTTYTGLDKYTKKFVVKSSTFFLAI